MRLLLQLQLHLQSTQQLRQRMLLHRQLTHQQLTPLLPHQLIPLLPMQLRQQPARRKKFTTRSVSQQCGKPAGFHAAP